MRTSWEFEEGAPSSVTPTPTSTPPRATLFSLQEQQTGDRPRNPQWQCTFHPDGLCLPCHRSLSCSTRQSSRTSASADRILRLTALTLGWDESLGGDNFCGKWHKYELCMVHIYVTFIYVIPWNTSHSATKHGLRVRTSENITLLC